MNIVTLKPANKRIKQLIREHGSQWEIVRELQPVQCFNGQKGLFIQSLNGLHSRWIEPDWVFANKA